MTDKGRIVRDVTRAECPWLGEDIPAGREVYEYRGHTYGCIGDGIAVSNKPGETPFYEVPHSAVKWDGPMPDPVDPEELGRAKERAEIVACERCDGEGSYWRVPDGFNPFRAGGFATARAMYRVQCSRCHGTGRAIERLDHHKDRTDDQP